MMALENLCMRWPHQQAGTSRISPQSLDVAYLHHENACAPFGASRQQLADCLRTVLKEYHTMMIDDFEL
jgi:hypothetical protein